MSRKVQYWTYYDLNFHSLTKQIWSVLDEEIPGHYQKELNLHITIHPRFQFLEGEKERFKHYVYEYFPQNINARITDFYYHPTNHQPMVICLAVDTDINFQQRQRELCNAIERNGGSTVVNPAPPHVTLYKSKDKGKGFRRIPPNVNQIKTRCDKIRAKNLPITVTDAKLVVEKAK